MIPNNIVFTAFIGPLLLMALQRVEGCNELVCGSIVSKCLLIQSCSCDLKDNTCSKHCFSCLGDLYSECCSCVDMCPQSETGTLPNTETQVGDFLETVPGLFEALTEDEDSLDRWTSFTYPVDTDTSMFSSRKGIKSHMQNAEKEETPVKPNTALLNCTVAFLNQCMSWPKCKYSCQSMGASSFQWFHDGCCECVGDGCINYGIKENKCRKCSLKEEVAEDYDDVSEEEMDFGENDYDDQGTEQLPIH